jgi:hypothetical protein
MLAGSAIGCAAARSSFAGGAAAAAEARMSAHATAMREGNTAGSLLISGKSCFGIS